MTLDMEFGDFLFILSVIAWAHIAITLFPMRDKDPKD
jgi:hypothetical protein